MSSDSVEEVRRKVDRKLEEVCIEDNVDSFEWAVTFYHTSTGHGERYKGFRIGLNSGLLSSKFCVQNVSVQNASQGQYRVEHDNTEKFGSLEAAIQNLNYRAEKWG